MHRFYIAIAILFLAALAGPDQAQVRTSEPPVVARDATAKTPVSMTAVDPYAAVVRVRAPDQQGSSLGSGTMIAKNGKVAWIITAYHVLRDATQQPRVIFPNGFESGAPVVKVDAARDLALLRIWAPPDVEPVAIADDVPKKGDKLTIAGYGDGSFRRATGQFVAFNLHRPGATQAAWMELATQARSGDSGGPILSADGKLAGVLWGASVGRTTGSHVLTLKWFLPEECRAHLPAGIGGLPRPSLEPPGGQHVNHESIRPNIAPGPISESPRATKKSPPTADLAYLIGKLESMERRIGEIEGRIQVHGSPGDLVPAGRAKNGMLAK